MWDYPAESCPEGATEIAKSVAESLGRCVVVEDAPAYLHRSFIHTGYYVGVHWISALVCHAEVALMLHAKTCVASNETFTFASLFAAIAGFA